MTLLLSNAGTRFKSAEFSIPKAGDDNTARVYTFNPSTLSNTQTIGYGGFVNILSFTAVSRQHAGNPKMTTIAMEYGSNNYILVLSHAVEIYEISLPIGTLDFEVPDGMTAPASMELYYPSGNTGSDITMPAGGNYTVRVSGDNSTAGNRQKIKSDTERVYYKDNEKTEGWIFKTHYYDFHYKDITTVIYKTPYTGMTYDVTYQVTGWIISKKDIKGEITKVNGGKPVACGKTVSLPLGAEYTAEPVLKEISRVEAKEETVYLYETTVTASNVTTLTHKTVDSVTRGALKNATDLGSEPSMNTYVNSKVGTTTEWKDS